MDVCCHWFRHRVCQSHLVRCASFHLFLCCVSSALKPHVICWSLVLCGQRVAPLSCSHRRNSVTGEVFVSMRPCTHAHLAACDGRNCGDSSTYERPQLRRKFCTPSRRSRRCVRHQWWPREESHRHDDFDKRMGAEIVARSDWRTNNSTN